MSSALGPSMVEVAQRYTELKRRGRQWVGRCPLHVEKTPSFTVSDEKQAFYCFGCHVGGGVIRLIELVEQTDRKGALKILGIGGNHYKPKPRDFLKQRGAAMVAKWMNHQHAKVGAMLREITRSLAIAEEAGASTLVERWEREFLILETLFEDLQRSEFAAALWAARDSIQAITAKAPYEPLPEFPPWTPEYAAYLVAHLPAPEAIRC